MRKNRLISGDALTMLSRLVLGGMFIYASFYKIVDPAAFAKSIWFYHILPGEFINIVAIFLPWLEALTGLALIIGAYYRGAVLLVNIMVVIFLSALISTVVRGLDIDCGCFRVSSAVNAPAWDSIYLDLVLLVLGIQLLFSKSKSWQLSNLVS